MNVGELSGGCEEWIKWMNVMGGNHSIEITGNEQETNRKRGEEVGLRRLVRR